jgi:hypothetical protein
MNLGPSTDIESRNTSLHQMRRPYTGWSLLIAYSLLLIYRAHSNTMGEETAGLFLWKLLNSRGIAGWTSTLVLGALCEFTSCVPVGVGAVLVAPAGSERLRQFSTNLPALGVGTVLTVLISVPRIIAWQHFIAVVGLVPSLGGCFFGTWAAITWLRGWRARFWLLPKVALLSAPAVLCMGITAWLFLEEASLPFEAVRVSPGEKLRLVDLVHRKSPESLKEDEVHILRLTEHDVNLLLSWILSHELLERKAMVRVEQDSISLLLSLPTRFGRGRPSYLNVELAADAGVKDGVLRSRVEYCRIGSVGLPPWLAHSIGPLVTSLLNHDRRMKPVLKAIREMTIGPDSIEVTYVPSDLPAQFAKRLLRPSIASERLLVSTRAQVDHLLLLFATSPSGDPPPSFNLCVKTALALARDRSLQSDVVTENQAAIFALGVLLGHPGIEDFLGPVVSDSDKEEARRILTRVVLHGRSDWTRHFCVSAVLALLSDESISNACGLLKEELDTDAGGSGFSFADLLVGRAGTAFGIRATRDAAAARALQDRLLCGFRMEDVCPQASDLPEGVSAADLQSRYGGLGGEGYQRLLDEIERRVAACAAYR